MAETPKTPPYLLRPIIHVWIGGVGVLGYWYQFEVTCRYGLLEAQLATTHILAEEVSRKGYVSLPWGEGDKGCVCR